VIVVVNSIPTLPTAHFWLNFRLNHQSGWAACFHSANMFPPFSSLVSLSLSGAACLSFAGVLVWFIAAPVR
jgi:hypothetical protein